MGKYNLENENIEEIATLMQEHFEFMKFYKSKKLQEKIDTLITQLTILSDLEEMSIDAFNACKKDIIKISKVL